MDQNDTLSDCFSYCQARKRESARTRQDKRATHTFSLECLRRENKYHHLSAGDTPIMTFQAQTRKRGVRRPESGEREILCIWAREDEQNLVWSLAQGPSRACDLRPDSPHISLKIGQAASLYARQVIAVQPKQKPNFVLCGTFE